MIPDVATCLSNFPAVADDLKSAVSGIVDDVFIKVVGFSRLTSTTITRCSALRDEIYRSAYSTGEFSLSNVRTSVYVNYIAVAAGWPTTAEYTALYKTLAKRLADISSDVVFSLVACDVNEPHASDMIREGFKIPHDQLLCEFSTTIEIRFCPTLVPNIEDMYNAVITLAQLEHGSDWLRSFRPSKNYQHSRWSIR